MRLFGYSNDRPAGESVVPASLAEVTVTASPAELRQMAEFLAHCADEMERMGDEFGHLHLSDRIRSFESSPHFVVFRG